MTGRRAVAVVVARAALVPLMLVGLACGGGGAAPDAGAPDAGPTLEARAGESRYALVGEQVSFDGSASIGATSFQWSFGDGQGSPSPGPLATATATYTAPGRYHAVLTVFDDSGGRDSDEVTISVTWPPTFTPRQSGTIVALPSGGAAVAATDSDEVVVLTLVSYPPPLWVATHIPVCDGPATISRAGGGLVVACPDVDTITFLNLDGSDIEHLVLPWGSRPQGAVATSDGVVYVSLQGSGGLAVVAPPATGKAPSLDRVIPDVPDARAVALLPDGRIAVTRWRSPDAHGLVSLVSSDGTVESLELAFDPQISSDTEIGGAPAFLDQFLVSPTGREAAVPSLMANTVDGMYKNGRPLTFQTMVRAAVSFVDLETGAEDFDRRRQLDNRGRATGAAWSPFGDYLYVTMPGNGALARLDTLSGELAGSLIGVGSAPRGLAVSEDGAYLFVDAWLSREVVIYDPSSFTTNAPPIARVDVVVTEPLPADVLVGKKLFNDSSDTRISRDGYMACANCHPDGDDDLLVWDLTQLGEGLRNTISLIGRAGTGDGAIHWSANFDEVQDFEHPIRDLFEGTGLMSDADFHTGTRDQPLGDPKAGISPELDALAAYVSSLDTPRRSPYLTKDGALTAAAQRGQMTFFSSATGCRSCHAGPRFTDSSFIGMGVPNLHDVGTTGPGSGGRLGGPLYGLDTPTLIGLWGSAPYLHDGSAPTLLDVLITRNVGDVHGATSFLTPPELDDLVTYLLSL